jgi:Uma2 family endonuclease
MSIATAEKLMTAEEFLTLPDHGRRTELVRGRVIEMGRPGLEHGEICVTIASTLHAFVTARGLGRIVGNDSGIVTERDPDTVRGADVCYYSYERLPRGKRPKGYPNVSPEVVFEVLSPTDTWTKVLRKVSEYLEAGVLVVCVVDPDHGKVFVYRPDAPAGEFTEDDELILPELSADFREPVRRFFE